MRSSMMALVGALVLAGQSEAADLTGPGRFCGYAPIIDLLPGESVTVLEGGIHGGSFLWEGAFGSLKVHGIGWASRPKGRLIGPASNAKPARSKQRRVGGSYEIAIWNGGHGAAYFSSTTPFTARQVEAISRVSLFEEGQTPSDCQLRTMFSWE
ncbi:hypothetical protein LJR219_004855 [Phenylobacterium sp. LjRoot219]|uniref:hypothetical protein n=1 Tax=Phenylobacterium sp. LjRoot219 TaxID=3342283 RepID=UPI003ED0557B